MMSKNPKLLQNEDAFIKKWVEDLKLHFSVAKQSGDREKRQTLVAQESLRQVLNALETMVIPPQLIQIFEPIFNLWRQVLKRQSENGFSTQDSAKLLLSLKTQMVDFLEMHQKEWPDTDSRFAQVTAILDILGVMTLALYGREMDQLVVNHETEGIHFSEGLIAQSAAMRRVFRMLAPVLDTDVTILLQGESGVGKDVVANWIHQHSDRKKRPFVAINCGAIPKELIEAELFGYEKGAFTGADHRVKGKFELAEGGTLFLDEIGELSLAAQVRLLRVLQNRQVDRLGSSKPIAVNVRVIAATHHILKQRVSEGLFRLDLFYRLNVVPVHIPPLRERREDIVALAVYFLKKYAVQFNLSPKVLSDDAKHYLEHAYFEGNVRELENIMQRMLLLTPAAVITASMLVHYSEEQFTQNVLRLDPASGYGILPLADVEKQALIHALGVTGGNVKKTAEALKISRSTLYAKLRLYEISLGDER